MQSFVIKQDKILRMRINSKESQDAEIICLPSFHRKISRAEMYKKLLLEHSDCHMSRTTFYNLAKFITRTQEKSIRALDYNITDLLHEPMKHLTRILLDFSETQYATEIDETISCLEDVYAAIQHTYPKLVGTSDLPPHHIGYSVGDLYSQYNTIEGTCGICELVLRFFKERLPASIDGKLGLYYSDIIENSLQKLILYMGHVV